MSLIGDIILPQRHQDTKKKIFLLALCLGAFVADFFIEDVNDLRNYTDDIGVIYVY